jgi:3,4-dihydroxy 2-butanone 4-phosphate synthase/GTP cyclohydrolase II
MQNRTKSTCSPEVLRRIEVALQAYARGDFLLVSDDEDRENGGKLVIAAEFADAAAIDYMMTYGNGLVCLAITPEIAARRRLRPMVERNGDRLATAYTVSVDASNRHGVGTGFSAARRAKTIEVLIGEDYSAEDLQSPGHLFPLIARAGGILERQGHTEAAVELSRLASLTPAGVMVEVAKKNGEMARRPDLEIMARQECIHYITIKDLLEYVQWRNAQFRAVALTELDLEATLN